MNKKLLTLVSLFALCAVFITSCSDDFIPKYNPLPLDLPHGMGYLTISIEGDERFPGNAARANVPNNPVPDSYKLTFTPAGESAFDKNLTPSQLSSPLYLAPGTYSLLVQAFVSGALVASGSPASNVVITAGSGTNCTVTLKAIIGTAGTQGTFNWNISFPSDAASAQMTVKPVNELRDLKISGTGNMTLNTGYYNIEIVLERANAKTIKHMEIVHVYQNLTTYFNFEFTEDHFNKNNFTLTLNYNDGVTGSLSQTVYHGGKISKPLDPVITPEAGLYRGTPSYTFEGWFLDGFPNVAWNFNDYTFIDDTTLSARWNTTNVDLTSSSGGNYIEKAFNYANTNAAAGTAYTLLVGSNESSATIFANASYFNLTIRAVEGASAYELDGMISVANGRLMLGSNIYIPPSSANFLIISPNASLIMSGNAQAGIIVLESSGTDTASVLISDDFTGSAGINLRGSVDINALRTLWNDKPIIKGMNDYTLTGYDVEKFALRDFTPYTGTTAAITDTHLLELDSGANAIVLREKPAVTVSVNGGAAVNYASLDAAFAAIGEQAGDFTVTLYEDQTLGARAMDTVNQHITLVSSATGAANERIIQYNGVTNLPMFWLEDTTTSLTLGNNITLHGISDSSATLLIVYGGTLTMENGSKVTGHVTSQGNGAISVNSTDARFVMNGGSVIGNTSTNTATSTASGISSIGNSTVTLNGGSISGNSPVDIYIDATSTLNLSGNTQIGVLRFAANATNNATFNLGMFNGTVGMLHLRSNIAAMNTAISYWEGKQVIRAATGYTLIAEDMAKFPLGNFYSSTVGESQPIIDTHIIGTVAPDLGKLVLNPATAPVAVNDGTVVKGYADLTAAFAAIGTQAGNFTVTLRANQTMTANRLINTPAQNITIIGAGGIRTINGSNIAADTNLFSISTATASLTLGENITIQGRTVEGTGAVVNNTNGTFRMLPGSKITGHQSSSGLVAAVNMIGASSVFEMSGGSIDNNNTTVIETTTSASGGVYFVNGTFKMSGGSITGNTHRGEASDVYFGPNSAANLSNSSFEISGSANIGALKLYADTTYAADVTIGTGWTGTITKLNLRANIGAIASVRSYWNNKQVFNNITAAQVERIGIGEFISTTNLRSAISDMHYIGRTGNDLGKLMAWLYAIGGTGPAGGIVFYRDPNGFTVQGYTGTTGTFATYTAYYLEAAPENESGNTTQWGANGTLIAGVTTFTSVGQNNILTIGVGRKDTQTIVNHLGTSETGRAAQVCASRSVIVGGIVFNDWFLPSLGELNEFYKLKGQAGVPQTGIPTTGNFWSSSQRNNIDAWGQYFGSGGQGDYLAKDYSYYVRAVRAF